MTVSTTPAPLIHRLNLNVVGGVEVSFAQYAHYRQGCQARDTVIVDDDINPRFQEAVAAPMRAVSRRGFRWWHGLRLPRWVRAWRAANAVCQAVRGDEQAVISWDSIGNREILDIARRAGLPLLHYEHGQAWRPRVRHAKPFFAHTRGVVANSRAAEHMLALRWGWQGPTQRVYCAVDGILPPSSARVRSDSQQPLRLGCAGRMIEVKGQRLALHALKILRDEYGLETELHIAGTGEQYSSLQADVARLGLESRVHFAGSVADMAAFYDGIDIMLVPSMLEPFGRTSIEAQARGCPVIVTAVDGLPETLSDQAPVCTRLQPAWSLSEYACEMDVSVAGIWPWVWDPIRQDLIRPRALRPDQLAESVQTLWADEQCYAQASRAGLAHVARHFGGQAYAPAVDAAFQNLLSQDLSGKST